MGEGPGGERAKLSRDERADKYCVNKQNYLKLPPWANDRRKAACISSSRLFPPASSVRWEVDVLHH